MKVKKAATGPTIARDGETDRHILPNHAPFHDIALGDLAPALAAGHAVLPVRHVAVLVGPFGFAGARASLVDQAEAAGQAHQRPGDQDEQDAAGIFAHDELPAEEDGDDDAELDDEVGRGQQEGERGHKTRPLGKERACRRERGEGAGA